MVFDKKDVLDKLSARIKSEWKKAETLKPDFLSVYESSEKKENENRIKENVGVFKEQLNKYPYPISFPGKKKNWKQDTEKLFETVLFKEPILDIEAAMSKKTLDAFKEELKNFIRRVRKFDPDLSIEGMGQAVRNYMVYAIFLELNGLEQCCSSSIFGYSMLYPYTDNYIDLPDRTREEKEHYNKLIEDKLKGVPYEASVPHEEKTAELLSAIEEDYDRQDDIFPGLLSMLEAQRNSQKQEDKQMTLTEEDILDISIYKGGLSVLIDRYFINKPLSENDLYFYYGFGFLLQLCDDLQDISEDKTNGSRTVFSICNCKTETEEKINKLLHYTENLFQSCESKSENFTQFLLRNCYFLILFSALGSGEHVSEELFLWMEERLPVSAAYFKTFRGDFSSRSLDENKQKYMMMLDTFISEY